MPQTGFKHLCRPTPLISSPNMGQIWERPGTPVMSYAVHAGPRGHTPIPPHSPTRPNPINFTPLPSTFSITRAHLRRSPTFPGMAGSGSNFDQSGSIDWGVIPFGLEEAMTFHINTSVPKSTKPGDGRIYLTRLHRVGSMGARILRGRIITRPAAFKPLLLHHQLKEV